ncbi:MAG: hypothetical protein ACRDZ3_05645 [Acidimicrobiia bacterium]
MKTGALVGGTVAGGWGSAVVGGDVGVERTVVVVALADVEVVGADDVVDAPASICSASTCFGAATGGSGSWSVTRSV